MKQDKFYWLGNAAKAKIINQILSQISSEKDTLIFDYACGDSGDWNAILTNYPNIKLIGYEPDIKSVNKAKSKLKGHKVILLTGQEIYQHNFQADYIVSFSVFEHVYNRQEYLQLAKQHLADKGLFYLNYDDGHFRNYLNLNSPHLWKKQITEWLHNILASPLAKLGKISTFQRRVDREEVENLIENNGFRVSESFYSNLSSLKGLQKKISPENKQLFTQTWLEFEDLLNANFCEESPIYLGDTTNLWSQMGSRTLVLRHL